MSRRPALRICGSLAEELGIAETVPSPSLPSVCELENQVESLSQSTNAFTNWITQKIKTHELGRQIGYLEHTLDRRNEEHRRQLEIQIEEYSRRLQLLVKAEKERFFTEIRKEHLEAEARLMIAEENFKKEAARALVYERVIDNYRRMLDSVLKILEEAGSLNLNNNRYYQKLYELCREYLRNISLLYKDQLKGESYGGD